MPTILPISDLRNYTKVLRQVDVDGLVYLTRNGRGSYMISRIDDYDRAATIEDLLREINKAESFSENAKTRSIDEVASKLGISL